jgi:hypothetical protein
MSLDQAITQSPVIVFIGAGASVPFGKPVMEQFVKRLAGEITSDTDSLFSALISERGYDLEAIMGDLETLLSLPYVSTFVLDNGY